MSLPPKFSPPGEGLSISPINGDKSTFKVTAADTAGAYFLMDQHVAPGRGPRGHMHTREDEGFYVVAGEFTFIVGPERLVAGPGSFLFGPRGIPHRFWNSGTDMGNLLILGTPAGLEDFFVPFGQLVAEAPDDFDRQNALASRFGIRFVELP